MNRVWYCSLVALVGASPAHADPVTYEGILGNSRIVVELTADPVNAAMTDKIAGRYFYHAKGIDIPLQPVSIGDGKLALAEEAPCGAACPDTPEIAAQWSLNISENGAKLTGQWGDKKVPIVLTRYGSRPGKETSAAELHDTAIGLAPEEPLTRENAPYDFLRLEYNQEIGEALGWPDARFTYSIDPRVGYRVPYIVQLSTGNPDLANAALLTRQKRTNLDAFACVPIIYWGFFGPGPQMQSNAEFDQFRSTTVKVSALTPKVLSWEESGSIFCGGAHPNNFSIPHVMGVQAGKMLDMDDMFVDVKDGKAGAKLVDFVVKRLPPEQAALKPENDDCAPTQFLEDYLAVYPKREGDELKLVFALAGLGHAASACEGDLMTLPVKDVAPLLKPEFAALLQ